MRAGALGKIVSVDILRGSEYPPYEGGPLPPWYRDAGYPFRDIGVHCLYLIQELLGPIEDVDADVALARRRSEPRVRRVARDRALQARARPVPADVEHEADAVAADHPRHQGRAARRSVRDVPRQARSTPLPKAAERLVNAFADSIQPLIDVPIGVWKFVRKEVQAYQGLRDLVADFYRRLAAGEPPPVTVEDAAQVVHWVEKVARAADADHAARLRSSRSSPSASRSSSPARRARSAARSSRLRADGHRVRVFVRRHPRAARSTASSTASATSAIRSRSIARSRAPRHRDPLRRGDEGRLARAQGRHRRRHAERDRRVQEAPREAARPHLVDVGDRLGRLGGQRPGQRERPRSSRAPDERGAYTRAKLEAEQLVVAAAERAAVRDPAPRPDLRRRHPADQRRGRAQRRRRAGSCSATASSSCRSSTSTTSSTRSWRAIDKKLVGGEVIQIIDSRAPDAGGRARRSPAATADHARAAAARVRARQAQRVPARRARPPEPVAVYRLQSALSRVHYERHAADRCSTGARASACARASGACSTRKVPSAARYALCASARSRGPRRARGASGVGAPCGPSR